MGTSPYFPHFNLNFKSNCCNASEKDERGHVRSVDGENLVQSRESRGLRRSSETSKENKGDRKEDVKMVKQSALIQSK